MKKVLFSFPIMVFAALLMICCGEKEPDLLIGKWDLTNDPSSKIQQTLELKDNNVFIETWVVTSDSGDDEYVLEIQGEYSLEGIGELRDHRKALCRVYDLESLSDPSGILEAFEDEDHFANENKEYNLSKKQDKVYGLLDVKATSSTLYYSYEEHNENVGITLKKTKECRRIIDNNEESTTN